MRRLMVFLGRFERGNFTVLGLAIGTLVAIILLIITQPDSNVEPILIQIRTMSACIVGIAITILFAQIGEIVKLDRTAQILGPYNELRHNPKLYTKVEELITCYTKILETDHEVFTEKAWDILCEFIENLSLLTNGRLFIEPRFDLLFVTELLSICDKKISASSYKNYEFWKSSQGEKYIKNQAVFANNPKRNVERIFILKKSEINKYKEILFDQKNKEINVLIALEEDIDESDQEGYVIYNDSAVRIERSTSNPLLKEATLIIDENVVKKYRREYVNLLLHSNPFEIYFRKDFKENLEDIVKKHFDRMLSEFGIECD